MRFQLAAKLFNHRLHFLLADHKSGIVLRYMYVTRDKSSCDKLMLQMKCNCHSLRHRKHWLWRRLQLQLWLCGRWEGAGAGANGGPKWRGLIRPNMQ